MNKKYNIGLDIGTTSVGWAVVEANTQKILRKGKKENRKSLWGVRLFEEASTAEKTRIFRSTRRRNDRRRERIHLLQEEFKEEIDKVDDTFFTKLKESKFHFDDKNNKTIIFTSDEKNSIKKYNEEFKTIYHLREELINNPSKKDIRLVYLAIHHIIKYRGNFLYKKDSFNINNLDIISKIKNVFDSLINNFPLLNISEDYQNIININSLETAFMIQSKNDIKIKTNELLSDISDNKNFSKEFSKLIAGNKFSIKNLFMLENLEKDITISLDGTEYEDKYNELETIFGDSIETLDALNELYDIVFLKKLFKSSNTSLSSLMVENYNKHKKDLAFLKGLFNKNRVLYNNLFRNHNNNLCLYERYIHNKISYEDFIKELRKLVDKIFDEKVDNTLSEQWVTDIEPRINNKEFLPRITSTENGKYPYQLNKDELIKIIENQGKYYPFLKEKIGNTYKLVKLLEFRIPYFVGPLVSETKSRFAWMVRKNNVKITPYNFDEVIDKEATAEKFIKRMISHCTYLLNEYALPNNSILYSRFKVLNELKQIKINGRRLEKDIQDKIMQDLFLKTAGVITDKKFKEYLYTLNELDMYNGDIKITGYSSDNKFANNMQAYVDFFGENGIFNNTSYNEEDADEIIEWITIFEDKDILETKVRKKYIELNEQQIKKIISKKYSGWGSLSKKLLLELTIKDKKTGINKNIMNLMEETEENFMQIINNDEYKFQDLIKQNNIKSNVKKVSIDLIKDLTTSPATKKGIYQSLKVVEEIIDYMGYEPENIVIEMPRGENNKQERKDDRKKYLLNIYKKIKEEHNDSSFSNYNEVYSELNNVEKIDSQKMFLYFIQEGKCLYSGKPLNIEDLNSYEIDHIIPRTLIKDDSIDNKALVYRECNQNKAANFVLPQEYRTEYMIKWWEHLKKVGLLSPKKFYRLTRPYYNDEDIQNFINRQLVETRQITKHVANIISNLYKNVNVVYLKASLSHNYREKYELFKFRDINDYHHAHDAYLAAVLGEYKEKYLKKDIDFNTVKEMNLELIKSGKYKQLKYGFVINSLDESVNNLIFKLSKNYINDKTGEPLFDANKFNGQVSNTLYRNDIIISRKTEIRSCQLYKETIYPAGVGNICLKNNMPTNIYGGYLNVETSYLTLIEYKNKKKLIGIPLEISLKSKKDNNIKNEFIKNHLNVQEEVKIIKDHIPFDSLLNFKGQKVYIKGYSTASKNCELSNALQLKIPKEKMLLWKQTLNYILNVLNKVSIPEISDIPTISDDELIKTMKDIINYLYEEKSKYPLFENSITKIENQINLNELTIKELSGIIKELFKIYHCNSVNGNLKDFGLGDRIGRLSGNNITEGTIISNSTTGLREDKYEF